MRILLVLISLLLYSCKTSKGQQYDHAEFENGNKRIRATAHYENSQFLVGGQITFESQNASKDWIPIFSFRHDDPVKIPQNSVKWVSEDVAYCYIGYICSITSNGGKSWNTWNALEDWKEWKPINYGLIESIELNLDGRGTIKLRPIGDRTQGIKELFTDDFGETWRK